MEDRSKDCKPHAQVLLYTPAYTIAQAEIKAYAGTAYARGLLWLALQSALHCCICTSPTPVVNPPAQAYLNVCGELAVCMLQ